MICDSTRGRPGGPADTGTPLPEGHVVTSVPAYALWTGQTAPALRPRRRLRRRVPLRPPTGRRAAGTRPRPDRLSRSASKTLSQALRLGWMVLPDALIDPVLAAGGGEQYYVDAISQLTMADFINTGHYDRHIRRMRMRYRRRRDALVDALADFDVEIIGLSAGVNMVLMLPDGTETRRFGGRARRNSNLGLSRLRHR